MNVEDLPEVLDFSRASLFAYRSGRSKVSAKALAKLEAAEVRAGLREPASVTQPSYPPDVPGARPQIEVPGMCDKDESCETCAPPRPPTAEERILRLEHLVMELQREMLELQREMIKRGEQSE